MKLSVKEGTNIEFIGKVSQGKRGSPSWPLFMYELIMEQLVNGTPPSAISDNILSFVSTFLPNTIVKELPSIWTVRRTRTILLIVVEALAAYQLGKSLWWKQLFTDGTSRRQTFFQNLAISIEDTTETDDGLLKLKPILLSTTTPLYGG